MAFTLADGVTYCDTVLARGRMTIDQFAPQISFFFYTHGDFFEEIAKYRAGRRRWATIVKERYHATTDKACMFRFGCVCGGASLYAPQARNNIIRVAYEAMASVLGGVQSMFTAAWDEPFALPSEESTTLALRTQQILGYETGIARVADPLGGSYYVEALTDATEEKIIEIMADLERHGGMVSAIEDGYLQGLIADEAYRAHQQTESGEEADRRRQPLHRATSPPPTWPPTNSTPAAATASSSAWPRSRPSATTKRRQGHAGRPRRRRPKRT